MRCSTCGLPVNIFRVSYRFLHDTYNCPVCGAEYRVHNVALYGMWVRPLIAAGTIVAFLLLAPPITLGLFIVGVLLTWVVLEWMLASLIIRIEPNNEGAVANDSGQA